MGITDIFQRKTEKKTEKKPSHVFTDTERQLAKIKRSHALDFKKKLKAKQERIILLDLELQEKEKLKQIKQVDLGYDPEDDDLYDDFEDDDPEDLTPEDKVLGIFEKLFSMKGSTPPALPQEPRSKSPQEIVAMIPDHIRAELRKKTPQEIMDLARIHYPDVPQAHIEAIIPLL